MARQERKAGGKKEAVLWLAMILALCGIVFCAYTLMAMRKESLARQAAQSEIRGAAVAEQEPRELDAGPGRNAEAGEDSSRWEGWIGPYARTPDRNVDFSALRRINEDIYAWITVPGTAVDYPIVFAPKGNEYYLNHDVAGNESKYGAIYTDGYNGLDFSDPVTIVYGHNMKDGSMFASLHNFANQAFFEENQTIRIYLADYMLEYEIIAAYKTGDAHILAANDFQDAMVFADYLEGIYSIRDLGAKLRHRELTAKDRLVALVTCVQGEDDARYFVQGALKPNDERS